MPRLILHLYVFLTGASILALEIAASRLLAPHFGTSLFVWGNILGIVLGALALGYYYGGRLADRSPHRRTLGIVTWSAGVITACIPIVSPFILRGITEFLQGVHFFVIAASFFGMLVLFALPLILLGALTPLAVRIGVHEVGEVGRVSGSLSAASTAGSLVGAFLPSFVLIPFLGTRATILSASIVLIALGSYAIGRRHFYLGLLLPLVLFTTASSARPARLLHEEESAYQHIRVVENEGRRYLLVNEGGGIQTVSLDENGLSADYLDVMGVMPALFPEDRHLDILVIGVAGGSVIRQFHQHFPEREIAIDAVEIDPAMFHVAETYFGLTPDDAERIVMDGRRHLNMTDRTYDLIVIDAFREELYVPFHLATAEFFSLAAEHLEPEGILAMNVIGGEEDGLLRHIEETVHTALPEVQSAHLEGTLNNVVVASHALLDWERLGSAPEAFGEAVEHLLTRRRVTATDHVLTDDRAPVEYLTDAMIAKRFAESL